MGSSSTPTPLPTLSLTAVHPRGPSRFPTTTTKPYDCRKRTCGKQQRRNNLKFAITYKRGKFTLDAFSDANWGNNPDNGKSTSCYVVLMCKAPISFKTGQQSLTAMSTMEAELVAGALAMKEAVFCSNMMK